jgi:VanZ family protein
MKIPKPGFIVACLWLAITTYLLVIPGSKFPQENWFDKIWLDKWVHIGLFVIMVAVWCGAVLKSREKTSYRNLFYAITILSFLYGAGMEFVQKYFVPNRSFDVGDIVADGVGCVMGLIFSIKRWIKK